MTTFGLWPCKGRLHAVGLEPLLEIKARRTGIGCKQLLDHLARQSQIQLVVTESMLATEPSGIAENALARGFTVWIAPMHLVIAISDAVGRPRLSARRCAGILARLPAVPEFRRLLRRAHSRVPQQLPLSWTG